MESMARLNERFKKEGLAPIKVIQTEPYVAHENLLEMIHAGMIPAGVVPDVFARLWKKVFKNLVIHKEIPVSTGMKAAWASLSKSTPVASSPSWCPCAHAWSGYPSDRQPRKDSKAGSSHEGHPRRHSELECGNRGVAESNKGQLPVKRSPDLGPGF